MINTRLVAATTMVAFLAGFTAMAGTWKSDSYGWWYDEGNGSYPKNTWAWIDGDNDGVSECYYFDEDGYSLRNTTTPDGYYVNSHGAWVKNDVVQTKNVDANESTSQITDNHELNRKVLKEYQRLLSRDPELQAYVGTNTEFYFGVIDIDRDGIYELDVYTPGTGNPAQKSYLLYYNEATQSVQKLDKFYEPLYILPNNQFFTCYSHMGLDSYVFSKVNGTWVQTESLYGYGSLNDHSDNMKIEAYSSMAIGQDKMVELTKSNINQYLSGDGLTTEINDVNDLKELIILLYEALYERWS